MLILFPMLLELTLVYKDGKLKGILTENDLQTTTKWWDYEKKGFVLKEDYDECKITLGNVEDEILELQMN
jgi:hypothetical protein